MLQNAVYCEDIRITIGLQLRIPSECFSVTGIYHVSLLQAKDVYFTGEIRKVVSIVPQPSQSRSVKLRSIECHVMVMVTAAARGATCDLAASPVRCSNRQYTGWPKKLYIFQHTISLEPFKIKWNAFHQLKWRQNLNQFKYDINQRKHVGYHFNVTVSSKCTDYFLEYEKDHQFVSQVASTENHLSLVLAAVNRVINRTIA